MGFYRFDSPYDWSRVASYRASAQAVPGGMIDLSVGSPVDPVPDDIRQALAGSSDSANAHGYPSVAGTEELRAAVPEWFQLHYGVDFNAIGADFVPTVGSKEAVALMVSLLHLGPGDIVVQPEISYPTYEIGTQLAGAEVLKVKDVADVDSWRSIAGVRAIWVNSPSNPTGDVLSSEQMRGIVAAAREIGAVVLSDECYGLLTWPQDADVSHAPAAPCMLQPDVCDGGAKGILVLYSMSKQSNMAGYRTALIAGDCDIVRPMTVYRKQIGQIVPGPVQAAMVAALRDGDAVAVQRARYGRRLHMLVDGLRVYGYDARMPQGALYVWVRAKSGDCWNDMADLARLGIIASPGEFYGDPSSLRFSSTATDEAIREVVARLSA
ncbi:succinyldiaminopimelate transaminase [Bifidobacterium commune]|uniref:Succinyldiaminopimelate aminotransferase apoenzyme n=1 Tax=Bifidobacterium commune TaxID=1505727 RepID=A0A1C4H4J8_9BIFI|nr:succinyldiaminopimelate transaminase [Bifidobacterium commune]SCC79826.1 succinyldiaminopimelate aminotransferase apoenzyme [Bifidobacterium commune]